MKAEECKVDYSSFRQMREEKVTPKRLGRPAANNVDIEPFTAKQDQDLAKLIRDTFIRKEAAFSKAAQEFATLSREVSSLIPARPTLMNDMKAFCHTKVEEARKVKTKNAARELKVLIRESKWERAVRPGAVVDMSGGKLSQNERKLLSFGVKFSTGTNGSSALDIATALNRFKYQYATDPRVPDIDFIRASVIPHLETGRHAVLPDRYLKAFRSLQGKKHLTVISADKGGAVGVLLTTRYHALGLDVLEDTTQFVRVQEGDKEGHDVKEMQAAHNTRVNAIADKITDKDMKKAVQGLVSPTTPLMPAMTPYPKLHKDPIVARPVISNINAPHSRSSKWASQVLAGCVGIISGAHISSTQDFHRKVKMHQAKGRLMSLDIKSLFTNIPVDECIEVIRDHSTGPSPAFNLPVDPNIFCELLSMCTSFNQFSFLDQHYRQVSGLPMGSSLSPVMANIYMEMFETYLMQDMIPDYMKPSLWYRFVDDVFACFEDMSLFATFLEHLNSIRPTIQFTFELSRRERVIEGLPDLPTDIVESLPFLELEVMRKSNGKLVFRIYRKPCHAGNYLHAFSYQPLSQKTSVIRSLFLRAYRYCEEQYLQEELQTVQQGFLQLGYTEEFIRKCNLSAHKGRMNELKKENLQSLQELPFAENTTVPAEKQEPLATITLPYHPCMLKLRPRLSEMGIRLTFSSNSAIGRQLRRKNTTRVQPRGSVYVVNCSGCDDVYVGQTGKPIEERMGEHSRDAVNDSQYSAVHKHNALPGHIMDLRNPTPVFKSDCKTTRTTVEAALLHVAPTIPNNTSSASNDSNNLVAPLICRSTRFNWKKLSESVPHLNRDAIPIYRRKLFGGEILRPHTSQRSQAPPTPISRRLRSRTNSTPDNNS